MDKENCILFCDFTIKVLILFLVLTIVIELKPATLAHIFGRQTES